jgi:hypothetical protein
MASSMEKNPGFVVLKYLKFIPEIPEATLMFVLQFAI